MENLTLKSVLSISGKPGLFKLVAQGKNMLIVESLADQKRQPAYAKDKVVSLSDVAIFTENGEKPLAQIFTEIFKKESGKKASVDAKAPKTDLLKYFEEVLPNFDKDRVYPTDIKKVIVWYNILIENGFTEFKTKEEEEAEVEAKKGEKKEEKADEAKPATTKAAPKKATTKKTTKKEEK